MFCTRCGGVLKNRTVGSKKEQFCSCGFSKKVKNEFIIKEQINQEPNNIYVHEQINPLADYNHKCKKCSFDKAHIETKEIAKCETWARCEPNRVEVICGKCGFRERLE